MDTTTTVLVVVAILAVLVIGAMLLTRQRKEQEHKELQTKFGPEYQRTVETYGDPKKAEAELKNRAKRVEKLQIRPLTSEETQRFSQSWQAAQARFVDAPAQAIGEAAALVKEVMTARGYPMGDFEQRAADISVNHPEVVSNYRAARDIELRNRQGKATTEDMRQAMVHYRALFNDLLETQPEKEMS